MSVTAKVSIDAQVVPFPSPRLMPNDPPVKKLSMQLQFSDHIEPGVKMGVPFSAAPLTKVHRLIINICKSDGYCPLNADFYAFYAGIPGPVISEASNKM